MNALQYVVKVFCTEKQMQKKELAKRLKINPASLSRTLTKGNPKPETLKMYANAFGVDFEDFMARYREYMHNNEKKESTFFSLDFCSTTTFGTDFAYSYIG